MKLMIAHFNNVLVDIEKRLKERGHEIVSGKGRVPEENEDMIGEIDVMVLWNEGWTSGRPWVEKAHLQGTPVVLVQHGRKGSAHYYPPFNEEVISDKVCVWGPLDKKRMVEVGVPSDKIFVTGSPVLQYIEPKKEHEGKNVVFCPEHWGAGEVDENLVVATTLRKLKGVTVKTKILAGEHNPSWYQNPIVSQRNVEGHLEKCVDLLAETDVVVSLIESTFELMAQAMDVPVVLADIWVPKILLGDERFTTDEYMENYRITSDAIKEVEDIGNLNDVIYDQLKNPDELKEERKEIVELEGGISIKDPVGEIIKVIESYA